MTAGQDSFYVTSGDVAFTSPDFRCLPVVHANPTDKRLKCRCEPVSGSKSAWSFLTVCAGVQNCCLLIHFSWSAVRLSSWMPLQADRSYHRMLVARLLCRACWCSDGCVASRGAISVFCLLPLLVTCSLTFFVSRFRGKM